MYRRLTLERGRLVEVLEHFVYPAFTANLMQDVPTLQRDLAVEFKLLAAFERCEQDVSPLTWPALKDWLMQRSSMHRDACSFFRAL